MTPTQRMETTPSPMENRRRKRWSQRVSLKVESFKVDQTKTTKEAKRKRAIKTNATLSSVWSLCLSTTCSWYSLHYQWRKCLQLWFYSWPYSILMGSCSRCDPSDASPMLLQLPYSDVIPQPLFDSDPPSRYSPFPWNECKILYRERLPSWNWRHLQEKSL
jgi:hypothetical protein